jgi:hypothetical protein
VEISQLQHDVTEYQRLCVSVKDYRQWDKEWVYYVSHIDEYNRIKREKIIKQGKICQMRKKGEEMRRELVVIENDKGSVRETLDQLYVAINSSPEMEKIRKNIDDINRLECETVIHQTCEQYRSLNIEYYNIQKKLIDENEKWEKYRAEKQEEINNYEAMINEIDNNLSILEQWEKYKTDEKEYLSHIELWDKYDAHHRYIMELKYCLFLHQSDELSEQLRIIEKKKEINEELHYWEDVLINISKYRTKMLLKTEIFQLEKNVHQLSMEYCNNKSLYDVHVKNMESVKNYENIIAEMVININIISVVSKFLSGYRIWLYEHVVIPETVKGVNMIVSNVTHSGDYLLEGSVTVKNGKMNINWSVNSPTGHSTMEKAGGFRKHIIGLIMRFTLSRQGCSNINNTQVFLDDRSSVVMLRILKRCQSFFLICWIYFPMALF